jgi:hypothetical protein
MDNGLGIRVSGLVRCVCFDLCPRHLERGSQFCLTMMILDPYGVPEFMNEA